MRIVADENIPALEAFFGQLPGVRAIERRPGRTLTKADLQGADALLVRSVTPVNAALLADTPVRFVGTATIGTDHIDHQWLEQQGIAFAAAPGCNANGVVDYVLSTLARHCLAENQSLWDLSVGIIGAGNVGGRLWRRLQAMKVPVHACDPPLADAGYPGLTSLQEVLAQDIVCLHTPLTDSGPYPTRHLLDSRALNEFGGHQLLLNAGRGPVVDNQALLQRLVQPDPPRVVLDVWENEPHVMPELLPLVWQGSPHIAGYSLEGKVRGTGMLYQAFCQHYGFSEAVTLEEVLPAPVSLPVTGSGETALYRAMLDAYDPERDHQTFMDSQQGESQARAGAFDWLRKHYPQRREFASHSVRGVTDPAMARTLKGAGFSVAGGRG